ncbi:TipJ family phage tail tip protein [Actinobacillus pleuropneumoniae]|uniref:TipJ family phage tail tip protein n=1 Tax=Actinobacillus pleuropneumoniae TaxID=715 RepID=UPI0001E49C8A|nr:phage tail protein [Actinobacillus pleuropneumoniae]EFN03438.1 Predicted phage tail protein [Actinobacillus pleuropneumoniae serovar 13 str. N273]
MGGSSGGSSHTPVEAPESGRSAQRVKIVEIISEGEIGGLVDGLKSIYLDNTPIQNSDGSYNFTNVQSEGRTGTQDQDVMSDFDTTEKEIAVSTEVKKTTPLTRTVTDANVTRLRLTLGVQSLFRQEDNGDTNGTSVDFKITVGNATYNLNINGKYSSQYLRALVVDNLPPVPFNIKVERITADSSSQRLQNKTVWASYTEIIDTDFAYPNTAYVGIKFDSETHSNIPTRTYEVYGIKVKVPSNYDPMTRKYTGLWDGTFKIAWTNNPAWVLLDILTNKRYGLGERLGDFGVDKWALYSIAQYCDQLVPDGYGNMEPRFTCNFWMTEQRSAYDVISDLCSIFRGIPVWNGTEMTFIIDRPADPVWTYTNANVINGEFSRQYSAKKSRHNAIQVEYKDKDNAYQSAIEYVSDNDLIRKNGFNLLKVTAFGCTSRGQAYRTGRWILETEKLETETVTFSVGSEGLMHIPGDIIRVTDNHFAGTNLGGRVLSVSDKVVTVDREITLPANSYFSYINAEAKHASIKITKINGTKLTLEAAPAGLKEYDVYSISSQKVTSRLYRCMTITEDDGKYTITALQHEPQKEAIVDNGASFEPVSTSLLSGGLQKVSNADVSLSENGVEITFDYAANTTTAVKYQVKLYRNGELYRQLVDVTDTKLTFSNLPDGSYTVEIRAKNERGQLSDPITRTFEINLRIPRFVTKSLLFAIELDWDLPKTATVGNYTELWRASENDVSKAVKVATLAYPQNNYTINGVSLNESYYFFARCGDKAGNKGEFTEGVFGEADHNTENLVNALEGKITQSHLGKSLIESLKADIDEAVGGESKERQGAVANALAQILAETQARVKALQDEAKARTAAITAETNNRTKAIQAESANLTKKIQDEANARGTAITQLQQTDAQQAQLITAVTAKADQAIAGLQEEKTARANADKAEAQARNALTSRVASAESSISNIQSTKASKTEVASLAQQSLQAVWQADAQAKIDALKVGGRNYLIGSAPDSDYWFYSKHGSSLATGEFDDCLIWRSNGEINTYWKQWQCIGYAERNVKKITPPLNELENGDIVTLSFEAQSTIDTSIYFALAFDVTSGSRVDGINSGLAIAKSETWVKYSVTRTISANKPELYKGTRLLLNPSALLGDNVLKVRKIKLELGTVATDWTPAPEEADSAISAVSADLTSYKQTQATKEQATSQQINGLTTRLANTESGISRVEKAVSDNQSSTATQLNQLSANLTKAQTDLNAKITQEQTARADADKANADRITSVTSRVASAESSISNIQSTKASKTEVASLAQQSLQAVWQADAQAKVDAISVGGRNLLRFTQKLTDSKFWKFYKSSTQTETESPRSDDELLIKAKEDQWTGYRQEGTANPLIELEAGKTYTISFEAKGNSTATNLIRFFAREYYQGGSRNIAKYFTLPNVDKWERFTFTFTVDSLNEKHNNWIIYWETVTANSSFALRRMKLEIGNVATDWTPAPEDADSAINSISSKVDSVQQTLTTANQALGSRIDTVTASVNDAKSQVSQVSKAVSDVSGKLSATHTLKTQVINGGRMAIAGIALGAESDGVTTESSVIVMADKFGIVANANDGKVKPVFSVANGQVGIRGDLVVAGSVTRDKLSGGAGENLLYNPIFANNGHGWTYYVDTANIDNAGYSFNANTGVYQSGAYLPTENQFRLQHIRKSITGDVRLGGLYQDMKLTPNTYYCFSVYTGGHRSYVDLNIEGGGIQIIHKSWSGRGRTGGFPDNTKETGVENWYRIWLIFKTNATNSAETNYRLIINTWGQNGQDSPMFIIRRPMLEECNASSTEPSPWSNAGAGPVHGGSIIANTIRGDHIMANQRISSPVIEGGSLNIGNGNFIVDSSGNVTAKKGTFSGDLSGATGTFKGDISAASGTFSGKIYAKNLIDDTAQAFTLQHGKSLTIPAFGKKRIIIVPACFCELRVNSAAGSAAATIQASASITITSSAGGSISGSGSQRGSGASGTVFLSGFFVVNANTATTINYTSSVSGSGEVYCPDIPIIAIC